MKLRKSIFILFFVLVLCLIPARSAYTGSIFTYTFSYTDSNLDTGANLNSLFYFFDLRERETFIQLTYPDTFSTGLNAVAHVQIFDVSNNCNENDFFDTYTPIDTHVYNMRDIKTNDGNDSGVMLSDGAYGIVAVAMFAVDGTGAPAGSGFPFGNQRIIDNNGYEYRTNAQGIFERLAGSPIPQLFNTFNFNQEAGITFSDVVGITVERVNDPELPVLWDASNPLTAYNTFDVDILDNNETVFSCRDVIFSCVDQDNPRLEELLEFAGTANVASFEYGINNAIPHTKGGELLCPGNNISEGFAILRPELQPIASGSGLPSFLGYIGLNNGNGRGSMDSFWYSNLCESPPFNPGECGIIG